jgi:predicted heme/steroid binding protein
MRKILMLLAAASLLFGLIAGCGEEGGEAPEDGEKVFTLEELAEFDGMDGRSAYVAVDGVVYDITGSPLWPEGDHRPCELEAMAGQDLTEQIGQSPHGQAIFTDHDIPVVGRLED